MENINFNLHTLITEAIKHMESEDDLNWSIGAAVWELMPFELQAQAEAILKEGYKSLS